MPELLTLWPPDFHVSPTVHPGSDEARRMTVQSGRKCAVLLKSQSPLGSSVRMLLESPAWTSSESALTWKPSVMKSNRLIFRLVPSEPVTSDTASGYLPTLTVKGNYNRHGITAKAGDGLITALKRRYPPPPEHVFSQTFAEAFMGYPPGFIDP